MADDKGYKDTKEFTCVGCGKKIILTKFASQKTCKCEDCKNNNVPINHDIVAEALKANPPKERKKSSGGDTKVLPCINCGKMVEVTKFASAAKVLCDECKGTSVKSGSKMVVDKSKLGSVNIAPLEEYDMSTGVIANERLRKVSCPACGHNYMKPLMVIDWSQYGLVVDYQCQACYLRMWLSEQTHGPVKIYSPGKRFDYTGRQVKELGMYWADSSRLGNALKTLIDVCEENNINIDEVFEKYPRPPYKWNNERPVPAGYVIPPEDEWIDIVDKVRGLLQNPLDAASDDYISISAEDARLAVDKLNKLLKGDYDGAK
ncbi:MAG: hypothetical protein NC247_02160 [Ruminococcus flavefaciens]|nr:hypothetical protein [Ruminococcus flavefaciens]